MRGRVLIIAGSDPSGGAGIQADIKTVTALGGYAMTAITALTAQNTTGVYGVHAVPIPFIQQQMRLCIEDIGVDCVKTGMLHSAAVIDAVCDVLDEMVPAVPLVVDPVMVAKGGAALLADEAKATLKRRLALIATVITPNVPEAESLAGMGIHSEDDMAHAATALLTLGAPAVFLKGGHMPGPVVRDLLVSQDDMEWFEQPRLDTAHTHGTGCTLASAIATGLAQGLSLRDAVARAQAYVHAAIAGAPGYGHGHGPIDHGHTVRPFAGR